MSANDNQLYIEDFQSVLNRSRGGQVKVVCPLCRDRRHNKADRALSINTQTLEYNCHYCGAKGVLKSRYAETSGEDNKFFKPVKKHYIKPKPKEEKQSEFAESFLEYFKGRGISEETLIKAKITQDVEYFPQIQRRSGCIGFNYYLNNELINVKYRTRGKDFKLISGAQLIPYNLDSIRQESYKEGEEKYAIITEGECFNDKAEILTPKGWVMFKDLSKGDKVAQYDNGNISFVEPSALIRKPYKGKMVEFSKERRNYYSLTTPNHNMLVTRNGKEFKIHACDINSQIGVVRSGYINGEGISFSDDQIRLFCAISADFTIRKEGDLYACFKKDRKVERIVSLLDSLGYKYSNRIDGRGYHSIFVHRNQCIECSKDFPMEWIGKLSSHQVEVILDEIINWDGNHVKGRSVLEYNTNKYNNALFVQTLCHLSGKRSTICRRSNEYGSWYKVTIVESNTTSVSSKNKKEVDYDGMVYCVTVPSGKILVRQNEHISVSGNCDAITYIECGLPHVVSVPNGASNNTAYLDDFIEAYFEPLDVIYVSSDNDTKGLELRKELIRRFGEDKCRIIDYPSPCKDINEVLVQYGKEGVLKCFKEYTELKPDGVQELVDVESNLDYLFFHGFEPGAKVEVPSLDRLISFKVGLLCVVTGVPSHGKTFALNFILSRLNIIHDWKIAFFSPEFYPTYEHMGQIIETLGGRRFSKENYTQQQYEVMKEYVCRNYFWLDPDDTDIHSVMERAKYLVRKKGIKALVIDPFNALTDKDKPNVRQDEYISEFLQEMRAFARKYGVAVFLVMHPTKMQKLDNGLYPVCDLYNCKGASEVFDKADIGLTAWRNEQDDYNQIHVTKVKFRHLGEKGSASFKFNINNGRYVPIEDADTLKAQGVDIKGMPMDWDNSNWILNKINGNQVQQTFVYPTQEAPTDNAPFGAMITDEVPF